MHTSQVFASMAVLGLTHAAPAALPPVGYFPVVQPLAMTTDRLAQIMPKSVSCDGVNFPAECINAAAAAPLLTESYEKFGINSAAGRAAIAALIAIESGELRFNQRYNGDLTAPLKNGQGTRNMMSGSFIREYATDLYGKDNLGSATDYDLVVRINKNEFDSMASAAWFLAKKCPSVMSLFETGSAETAWAAYLGSDCIGTTSTEARTNYWVKAKAAFAVSS